MSKVGTTSVQLCVCGGGYSVYGGEREIREKNELKTGREWAERLKE